MKKGTFIKVDRKILEWRWFKDKNTLQLFLYLLLKANIIDIPFEDKIIHRGELVTSLSTLSNDTGQTKNEVRTALKHLKLTGEITCTNHSKYQVISIVNYDLYQGASHGSSQAVNTQITRKSHANHTQITTSEEYKNDKNLKIKEEEGVKNKVGKQVRKQEDKSSNTSYITEDTPSSLSPYGVFKNVFLSDEETEELRIRFPLTFEKSIDGFSSYMKATGKTYESHYARLLGWCEDDLSKAKQNETGEFAQVPKASYDIKRAEERARTTVPKVKKREKR